MQSPAEDWRSPDVDALLDALLRLNGRDEAAAFLRDLCTLGELRDLEMIELCVQAAMTGHLVLTTLHAQTSVGAIRRLIDCGLEPFMANSTVEGVITPRLVRMLCPQCRRPAAPGLVGRPAALSPFA